MKTCSSCKWWKPAAKVVAVFRYGPDWMRLGYCEQPDRWKGLVAKYYSCDEHEERGDAEAE